MSEESLQRKVFSGLFWKFGERIGAQLVSFIVRIVLARLLSPSDFGVIVLITVFIDIANVFVSSGFGSALIQKKEAAYVYVYQQKDQYIAFCEGNEQADELGFYEADLEEQKRYLDSYREFISQMQDRSKAM